MGSDGVTKVPIKPPGAGTAPVWIIIYVSPNVLANIVVVDLQKVVYKQTDNLFDIEGKHLNQRKPQMPRHVE